MKCIEDRPGIPGRTVVLHESAECTVAKSPGLPFVDSDSQVMVPLYSFSSAFGLTEEELNWDQASGTAVLAHNGIAVIFTVGSTKAIIQRGGDTSYMLLNAAPMIQNGCAYLPIRYLAAAFGYQAAWDGASPVILLNSIPANVPQISIYLTRHGKTMFNTMGRVQGWCDSPLTEEGAKVAADLGKGLKASGITFISAYSSDLGRQRETAHVVLNHMGLNDMPVKELLGLREVCFGSWEGELESVRNRTYCEIAKTRSIYEIFELGGSLFNDITVQTDTTGQAESLDQVQARMLDALAQIVREAEAAGGGNVLAVSSGGIITSLIQLFTGSGASLVNASVTTLAYRDGVFILNTIGDTGYSALGATID